MGIVRQVARGLILRCPNCGRGRIFRVLFEAHRSCPACGRVYETTSGDWTGGAELTLLLALPLGIALLFALMAWTDLEAWQEAALVMAAMAIALPLVYRHVKGAWLGILRAWEGPDPKPVPPPPEVEWLSDFWDREHR